MRISPPIIAVMVIVGLVLSYLVLRPLLGGDHKAASDAQAAPTTQPVVQVVLTPEFQRPYSVTLRGRTQAIRTVIVRSETAGVVAETPVPQGSVVAQGAVLCRLAVDARKAALDQAEADLQAKRLQRQASERLAAQGFRSPTQVLVDEANMDASAATVRQAEVALAQVNIRAPFAGVFDHRDSEVGSYLAPGQSCGTVIELDPLLIVGDLPETETAQVKVGAIATAKLVSGQMITGRVRYVGRDADPTTRTYRVEIVADNSHNAVASGLSADLQIEAGVGPAHLAPVSALVLDASGRQGLRYVQDDGSVAFAPVTVLEETPQGLWVAGLHGPTRIITVGQSYVSEGQRVKVASR